MSICHERPLLPACFDRSMDFLARIPVADLTISSYKNPCDIHLKHVLLAGLNLWQNPAYKVH
jgi:hypothetical protein